MSPQPSPVRHWADVLDLRSEVQASDGSVGDLQMSLYKAVYRTVDVPYRKVDYYNDITEPTPNLIGFFGKVARRLGADSDATALFHLDQGMGGGKSHALVGLYHMSHSPEAFFATDLGQRVRTEAEYGGEQVDLTGTKVIPLTADHFSPGKPNEIFGPATTLFERFIWALVDGDMDRYQRYVDQGSNKATIQQAFLDLGRPVLILLDELMDYVLNLTDATQLATLPGEKAFLNALMDACDDVPRVAFVVVMIRSELDERGYTEDAESFRDYVAQRLVRNGTTVAVTEAQDFASIIRRRLFEMPQRDLPTTNVGRAYVDAADTQWRSKVFDKLGANRGASGFADRVTSSYPFHPELMRLVQDEWSRVQGFQRVRSTVAIFAQTAVYWVAAHRAGRWAPKLIGIGDIPLTVALEKVLSSGLLLGNERAVQGYRSVASTDLTSTDGTGGRAVGVDAILVDNGVELGQPTPAVRMATALFCYSLVSRAQGRRGATKPELLLSVYEPANDGATPFTGAEEVFNILTGDEGLGSLEITNPPNAAARYYLSITQTLRMYFRAAQALVKSEERDDLVWDVARELAHKGPFDEIIFIDRPAKSDSPLDAIFDGIDSTTNRLVVVDSRRWALLNGKDSATRTDIEAALGLGPRALRVDNAASCIIACANTQRRDVARRRAGDVLAWHHVSRQLTGDNQEDLATEAKANLKNVKKKLDEDVAKAYQHYAYLLRAGELLVEFKRFDNDTGCALTGTDVWNRLVTDSRAAAAHTLSADYLAALLQTFDRTLTVKEVVHSFYKNPAFPLAPSTDEIRRVIFELINDGWELVDSDGNRLSVTSPGQISINSISQVLRPRKAATPDNQPGGPESQPGVDSQDDDLFSGGADGTNQPVGASGSGRPPSGGTSSDGGPRTYKRYHIELVNRSITSAGGREQVWRLLRELAKTIDPANPHNPDHQLINLSVTLTTAEGDQGDIEKSAQQAEAKVRVEDDDF